MIHWSYFWLKNYHICENPVPLSVRYPWSYFHDFFIYRQYYLHQYSINTPCWTAQIIGTEYIISCYQYIINTTRNILQMKSLHQFIIKPHHLVKMVYQYWLPYNFINIQSTHLFYLSNHWPIVLNNLPSIYHSCNKDNPPDEVTISFHNKTTQFGNDGLPLLIPL